MFRFLKSRVFLGLIGLAMLALFIWYAGPYFAFGNLRPLESTTARLIAIALTIAAWVVSAALKQAFARRASDRLVTAVVKQAEHTPPSPDAIALRERFEEAVAILKQKRKSGHTLYELPWYVFIGAPGSGKTTALVNSGLHFPLEQRVGKGALRGIGGTRHCDWWFTDEAVFLDTAGRYTTQDSDASADSAAWREFLSLLRKYRGRRPINGIVLTISAQDLITHGPREREAHVAAARRRLEELNRELRIQLPVYLMVTKCDLVAGFTEYFDDLAQEARAQVWGVTFPYEETQAGRAAEGFPKEFGALITRLNERLFARVEEDHDVGRRARIFAFPQQMEALGAPLSQFVAEVFRSTRFEQQVQLRGVYFTSGTQEGTPIDRVLAALGHRFAVAPQIVSTVPGRGKAYFIERLLKQVMLTESGLAGVNRRLEVKKAALQLGTYAAIALVTVVGVIVLSVSYRLNRSHIGEVSQAVEAFRTRPPVGTASLETLLPLLDAAREVSAVANKYEDDTPLSMRWGLYQGGSLGKSARDAYSRELDGALVSAVAARFSQRLIQYASEPDKLFEYLKAYLMLGDPDRLDPEQLAVLADYEWQEAYADNPGARDRLSAHFRSLLENEGRLRPVTLDQQLVAQARTAIRQASIPRLIYGQLKLDYPATAQGSVRLDTAAGLGADQALRRKSGVALSQPIPALYTKPVFLEVTTKDTEALIKRFAEDHWVWGGDGALPITASAEMKEAVVELYEQDYVAAWEKVLADVEVVPFPNVAAATRVLAIVAGSTSPLRALLKTVDEHTFIVPPSGGVQPGAQRSTTQDLKDRLDALLNKTKEAVGISTVRPGARITQAFASIHELVAGDPGNTPLDRVLALINQIQQQLRSVGTALGQTSPVDALAKSGRGDLVTALRQDAQTLPPVVGDLVSQVGGRAEEIAVKEGGSLLERRYQTEVVGRCAALLDGKYPFVPSETEVTIADFAEAFGYGGLFDRFFKENLEALVDVSRPTWAWRTGGTGASVGVGLGMLRQFQRVQAIREMFFPSGSRGPDVGFAVTPVGMDTTVQKFVLEIDGARVEYQFGPERSTSVKWPGQGPVGGAATFEARAGNRVIGAYQTPWGWFRLLETVRVQPETGTRYVLAFENGGARASVRIDADRASNPFAKPDLRQFRCV